MACCRNRSLLPARRTPPRQVLSLNVNNHLKSSVNGGLVSIKTILKTIPDLLIFVY